MSELATAPQAPSGFHLLAKPSGSTWNIDCAYCFFLSKEALYPNDKHRMSEQTLEIYIRQMLESHSTPTVTVAWHIPIVERATEQTIQIANQGWKARPGMPRLLYTQTGDRVTDGTVGSLQYGQFLIEVFEEWVRHDVGSAAR